MLASPPLPLPPHFSLLKIIVIVIIVIIVIVIVIVIVLVTNSNSNSNSNRSCRSPGPRNIKSYNSNVFVQKYVYVGVLNLPV